MHPSKRSTPWIFFALTYGWSWAFWIPAALSGKDATTFLALLLRYFGGVGPPLAGITLTYFAQDREGWRDYWRRVIEFKRIGIRWYTVILLIVPLMTFFSAFFDVLFGGMGVQLEATARFIDQPLAILPFVIFTLIFGPLPEELGWRGYALDRLQMRWSALASSLGLGVAWAVWHTPLFFIKGTYQNNLGFGSLSFWIFMMELIPLSILYTWIYNNNQRSTLSAVLLHFMVNFIGELFELTKRAELYQFLLWVAAAIVVTLIWEPETLIRKKKNPHRVTSEITREPG